MLDGSELYRGAAARRWRWSAPRARASRRCFALLQRFYDVSAGRILVDGVDIRDVDPRELRQRFAYVEQEPTIFAGTIAENIRFGKPEASDAEVEAAAEGGAGA